MTPENERWEKLQALFHTAEAHPGADLDELLLRECDDAGLRARARALIEAARRTDTEQPLPGTPALPEKMGPYTLLRHLGTGGIGSVYLVERMVGGAVQRSALKVLARGAGGAFFAERFAREQYILASLQHENITRMLDAGVSDAGQPYLVMEYVDGVHLDQYCDQRGLGVPARLQLFLQVCHAISYAHQNLVVHLDLKPSNILVTGEGGAVKVLDFGTSKLIQPDSLLTTTVMATPAYASPEQLLNEPVTTVCDVYALGAILFELLSGRRPNQDSSVALLIERSLKEFPPEPITENLTGEAAAHRGLTQTRLRSLLSGDLATIVTKCLNPRPKDRYATVDALIDDVQRYLDGRPIQARPQTTTYRLGKFVRRNRVPVIAGTLAVLALAASLGYAAWRQHQAVIAGRRAMQMQTFMVEVFRLANPDHTGKPVTTVPELLQIGMKVLPDLIPDASDRRAAQLSLAGSMNSNDDYNDAERSLTALVAEARASHDLAVEAVAETALGDVEDTLGRSKQALDLTAHALTLVNAPGLSTADRIEIRSQYAFIRNNLSYRDDATLKMLKDNLAEARREHLPDTTIATQANRLSSTLRDRGQIAEADDLTRQSLAIYQRMPYATCDEGRMYRNLGNSHSNTQDYPGALDFYTKAYEKSRQCSGDDSLETLRSENSMANAMLRVGKPQQAVPLLEASLPKWRKAVGSDSPNLIGPLLFMSRAYSATGQYGKAEALAQEATKLTLAHNNHGALVGVCQEAWAQAFAGERRYPEALLHAQAAVDAFPPDISGPEKLTLQRVRQTLEKIEAESAASRPK